MINLKTFEFFGDGEFAIFSNDSGEKFWGNYAAGSIVLSKKTKRFLLNYRSKYVNEPNVYGLWGGKVEDEDSIESTVLYELYEESNYNGIIVDLIPLFLFKNKNKTFEYHNFLAIIEDEFTPKLNWESEGYKWLTFDELLKLNKKHPGLELLLKDNNSIKIIKNNI